MTEAPKFVHSPIHMLPTYSRLNEPSVRKAITLGRIAAKVEQAVKETRSKKK